MSNITLSMNSTLIVWSGSIKTKPKWEEATPTNHFSSQLALRLKKGSIVLEELAFYYCLKAFFVDMETWSPQIGQVINPSYFSRYHKIHRGYKQLMATLLDRMKPYIERGCDKKGDWIVVSMPPSPSEIRLKIKEIQTHLLEHLDSEQETKFLSYMGNQLLACLMDYNKGLSSLFPDTNFTSTPPPNVFTATQLYAGSVSMRNSKVVIMEDALIQFIQNKGEDVKILEIGAGTGGTTLPILQKIAINSTSKVTYRFTDISSFFVTKGKERFAQMFPSSNLNLEFGVLDIESEVNDLDELGGNDVVLTADVFHATRYLDDTLSNVRKLLKPGGVLILGEIFKSDLSLELTFGLTEGWWRFSDKQRFKKQSPLLDEKEWVEILEEHGFKDAFCKSDGSLGVVFATAY